MILFFDESRFGTHSNIGYGWFEKGKRTKVKIKLGYKNFYLYSAIDSKNGYNFTLLLPKVNTECMNIFLTELSKEIKNKKIKIVMDGASWHKSKGLKSFNNIEIILLPPYSPELNPVERFWQYIKNNTIKNKFYKTIEDLEKSVCNFLTHISDKNIKSVCSANYLYN